MELRQTRFSRFSVFIPVWKDTDIKYNSEIMKVTANFTVTVNFYDLAYGYFVLQLLIHFAKIAPILTLILRILEKSTAIKQKLNCLSPHVKFSSSQEQFIQSFYRLHELEVLQLKIANTKVTSKIKKIKNKLK